MMAGPLLFTFGNAVANVAGIISTFATGVILTDHADSVADDWQRIFGIYVAQLAFTVVVFACFMEGSPQPSLN